MTLTIQYQSVDGTEVLRETTGTPAEVGADVFRTLHEEEDPRFFDEHGELTVEILRDGKVDPHGLVLIAEHLNGEVRTLDFADEEAVAAARAGNIRRS